MQNIQKAFNQLSKSIYSAQVDFQLFLKLKEQLRKYSLDTEQVEDYLRLIVLLYELSNYEKLYIIKRDTIQINQLAIQLKALICGLMSNVIYLFDRSLDTAFMFPSNLISHAIQIMIICTRICLNETKDTSTEVHQHYKAIHNAFEFLNQNLDEKTEFLHHLNTLEIIKYRIQSQAFSIQEFEKKLTILFLFEDAQTEEYSQLIQGLVMEILLKSLKSGKASGDKMKSFYPYLTQPNQQVIDSLISNTSSNEAGSKFLQIFNQIKMHGIESVNFQYLQDFIRNEDNFNDDRIFEIAAITKELIILEIWFSVANSKKQKCTNLQKALNCFIHLCQSRQKRSWREMLKLSNNVMLMLLTQKRDNKTKTSEPVLSTIKSLVTTLSLICFSECEDVEIIADFGDRLCLLCSRYSCIQICKVISSLLLYYFLSRGQKCVQIYQKFNAYHHNQRSSELYQVLRLAYEFQNGISEIKQKSFESQLIKQTFIAILFTRKDEDMLIFQMEMSHFKTIQNKIIVYAEMLKKYMNNGKNLCIILIHMENTFIKFKFDEFIAQSSKENLLGLKNVLYFLLKKQGIHQNERQTGIINLQKNQICFLLLNLLVIENSSYFQHFNEFTFGILLNKFSKHVKVLNEIMDLHLNKKILINGELYGICCSFLIFSLQKFKRQHLKKQRIGQAGQIIFINSVSELVRIYLKIPINGNEQFQQISKLKKVKKVESNYILFVIFELDCLSNDCDKYLSEIGSMQIDLLKIFNESLFIPRQLKHRILRQVVKESLGSSSKSVSIKQMKEIIELTQNEEQVKLYIHCLGSSYGIQGKELLMLMAHSDKRIQRILLNDEDDLSDIEI